MPACPFEMVSVSSPCPGPSTIRVGPSAEVDDESLKAGTTRSSQTAMARHSSSRPTAGPCRDREHDPGSQARRGPQPPAVGQVRRQRGVAGGRGHRLQPRPLDRPDRSRCGDCHDEDSAPAADRRGRTAHPLGSSIETPPAGPLTARPPLRGWRELRRHRPLGVGPRCRAQIYRLAGPARHADRRPLTRMSLDPRSRTRSRHQSTRFGGSGLGLSDCPRTTPWDKQDGKGDPLSG